MDASPQTREFPRTQQRDGRVERELDVRASSVPQPKAIPQAPRFNSPRRSSSQRRPVRARSSSQTRQLTVEDLKEDDEVGFDIQRLNEENAGALFLGTLEYMQSATENDD